MMSKEFNISWMEHILTEKGWFFIRETDPIDGSEYLIDNTMIIDYDEENRVITVTFSEYINKKGRKRFLNALRDDLQTDEDNITVNEDILYEGEGCCAGPCYAR